MLHVVLEKTSHPGNIGSVARAMKTTMSDAQLILYQPECFPSSEATQRAKHAETMLDRAVITDDLQALLMDMDWVFACTKKPRDLSLWHHSPEHAAYAIAWALRQKQKVACLFGNETSGLSNTWIARSHAIIEIPMPDERDSLNLSHAVQVVLYAIFQAMRQSNLLHLTDEKMPDAGEKQAFQDQLQCFIADQGLEKSTKTWEHLQIMLARLRPNERELRLLFAILKQAQIQVKQ